MKIFKHYNLWLCIAVVLIVPMRLTLSSENQTTVQHPAIEQAANPQTSYMQKVGNVLQKKIDYLQSEEGIENTFVAVSTFTLTTVLPIAFYMYMRYKQAQEAGVFVENAQIYYPGDIKLTFADVAGLSGAKADMQDIINYLKNSDEYQEIGAKIPKGVLMNGGPGCGKTLLAKAFAGEVNCPFISMSGPSLTSMWVGAAAMKIKNLFIAARKLAEKYGACVVFIDEMDSIAPVRSSGNGGAASQDSNNSVNALLAEMDGLDASEKPIIVLGATNRAADMDEAVVRPGRFDRIVQVPKPSIKDRVELLTIVFEKVKSAESIDIDAIARATQGFSGAELANLVNEAAILAVNDDRKEVEMSDIELASDNITLGREIMGMDQSDDAKWKTAIHEAGHTIALLLLDKKNALRKSSITPRGKSLGVMWKVPLYESYDLTKEDMLNTIVMNLAGRLAEEEFGMGLSVGASSDLEKCHSIAYDMVARYGMSDALQNIAYSKRNQLPNDIATQVEREIEKIIKECTAQGKKLIAEHRNDIEKIAKLMMEKGTVQGDEIYNLLGFPIPKGIEFKLNLTPIAVAA